MTSRRAGPALIALAFALALGACQTAARRPATFIDGRSTPPAGAPEFPQGTEGGVDAGGAVQGGIADSDIARSLGDTDRQRAAQAEYFALETAVAGRAQTWSNPQTNSSGTIVVGETYEINRTRCRDYTHTVTAAGDERTLRATACRQPNGTWRSVSG